MNARAMCIPVAIAAATAAGIAATVAAQHLPRDDATRCAATTGIMWNESRNVAQTTVSASFTVDRFPEGRYCGEDLPLDARDALDAVMRTVTEQAADRVAAFTTCLAPHAAIAVTGAHASLRGGGYSDRESLAHALPLDALPCHDPVIADAQVASLRGNPEFDLLHRGLGGLRMFTVETLAVTALAQSVHTVFPDIPFAHTDTVYEPHAQDLRPGADIRRVEATIALTIHLRRTDGGSRDGGDGGGADDGGTSEPDGGSDGGDRDTRFDGGDPPDPPRGCIFPFPDCSVHTGTPRLGAGVFWPFVGPVAGGMSAAPFAEIDVPIDVRCIIAFHANLVLTGGASPYPAGGFGGFGFRGRWMHAFASPAFGWGIDAQWLSLGHARGGGDAVAAGPSLQFKQPAWMLDSRLMFLVPGFWSPTPETFGIAFAFAVTFGTPAPP